MNAALAQARRLAVSPYARRLARERALPLEILRGSGPHGRILAADVLGFASAAVPAIVPEAAVSPEPVTPPAPATAPIRIASFATSIALGPLKDLLKALETSGHAFDIEDVLLRAAGRASAQVPDVGAGNGPVALELAGRQAVFVTVPEMPMLSLRATRLAALADGRDDAEKPATLSLRLLAASDIRPVMMPLLADRAMRLTVCVATAGDCAECLFTVDAASLDEAAAAAWLLGLKSSIERPLRLFV
ncbi:MAG: E3 binding domain-containing protein [Mesorhizobium sp.]|uniref:E3 binding domain-containing protein n=1 Tax=Mesorhizobium sp. TaxID=1871066 RepID=UPI001AC23E1A|nr:E3 binding domain-containing protein [Mesorhizobium sp.]MBN9218663.1 E3 binding domain-containing protein [Mesorhizobium sp.]